MKDLHVNDRLDLLSFHLECVRTWPLEKICNAEWLAMMRGKGMTDEDIRAELAKDDGLIGTIAEMADEEPSSQLS
jgi:hypothetical protein